MDYIKAITERRSVRTFDTKRPVSEAEIAEIQSEIDALMPHFPCEKIEIKIVSRSTAANGEKLGTYGVISAAEHFLTVAMTPEPATIVAAAYMAEQLVLYLTAMGIGTVWLGGTLSRSRFAEAAGVGDDLCLPAIIAFGYPAKPRFAERVMRTMVRAATRKPFESLFFDGTPSVPLTETEAGDMRVPLEMVRLAPSATNAQPWRVIKTDNSYLFFADYKASADSLTERMKHLDMGISLTHFCLTCKQLSIETKIIPLTSAPAPAIVVPSSWHFIATVKTESH